MADFEQFLVQLDEPPVGGYQTGIGCFGVVYRSTINGAPCVVKKLHDILTGVRGNQPVQEDHWRALVQTFQREIMLLSQQRHPNIVQFLGVYKLGGDPRDICLVMEELDIDLNHFIATKHVVPIEIKFKILTDIACGVSHLHSKRIVHRDLNAGNVLLSTDLRAKVADLGVSRVVDTRQLGQLTENPGAQDYMPPEAIGSRPVYNQQLDCFSFGHLALYLILQEYPSPCELSAETIKLVGRQVKGITHGVQIVKRKEWFEKLGYDHPLYQVIAMCLQETPYERWEMDKVRTEMNELSSKPPPKLIDLLRQNEVLREDMLRLTDKTRDDVTKIQDLEREVNTQNDLQVRCDILEGELQTEKQIYTSMDSEMKKLRINNVKLMSEINCLREELNSEKETRNAWITRTAKLEQQLFDTKMRLRIPLTKIDTVSELSTGCGTVELIEDTKRVLLDIQNNTEFSNEPSEAKVQEDV